MKTISLRTLLRTPVKVKLMTRGGRAVRVTDNGQPLWVIQPAVVPQDERRRRCELEDELAAVLREAASGIPLSKLVLQSRR